ncbi:hypothetical protein Esi_0020_0098 [Ectocarpus siliculosus]|uniref:Uncharacterized protein n=1 Tax=Ectocarpus siliculosus TaxID=2880 RepID=D8LHW5_ECTSI|nr:hypothetical protein Esi_0020_0098 [Ectocarpus siliculosus]|eukprot:CBN74396.1 hypothetical protein Esi_0020_0098 [Ectocarpus siliculosus]
MDSTPTPPRRQSDRRSTPRHHNSDEGHGSPPDGSRLGGEFTLAHRGGDATTPFSVADSSPYPGDDAAGGGGGTPEPEGGSAANKGSTRLCWTPAEKVVLWKAIQKHNPFAESGQKLAREHWRRVAASVIEEQDVEIYTNEGGRETVHVAMQENTKNLPFETLVSRCKQLFDENRRSKEKAEKDSEGKTGEGEKDAEVFDEENEEGSEDCELLKAMACREAGIASKKKGAGPSKEHMYPPNFPFSPCTVITSLFHTKILQQGQQTV